MATWNSAKTGNWTAEDTWGATWVASTAYAVGDRCTPSTLNSHTYECTTAGTSDTTEPTWPTTNGDTVTDGGAVWTCRDGYPNANGDVVNLGHTVTYDLGDSTVTFGNITINSGGVLTFPTSANSTLYVGDTSGSNDACLTINDGGQLGSTTPIGADYHCRIYVQRSASGNSIDIYDGATVELHGSRLYGTSADDRYAYLHEDWTSGQTFYVDGDYSSKWKSGQHFIIWENTGTYEYDAYKNRAHIYTIDTVGAYDSTNDRTPITIVEAAPGISFPYTYNGYQTKIINLARNVEITDPNSSWDYYGWDTYSGKCILYSRQGSANDKIRFSNILFRGLYQITHSSYNGWAFHVVEGCIVNFYYGLYNMYGFYFHGDIVSVYSNIKGTYSTGEMDGTVLGVRMVSDNCGPVKMRGDIILAEYPVFYSDLGTIYGNIVKSSGIESSNYVEVYNGQLQCSLNTYGRGYFKNVITDYNDPTNHILDRVGPYTYFCFEDSEFNGVRRPLRIWQHSGSILPLESGDTDWQAPPSGSSWILEATPSSMASLDFPDSSYLVLGKDSFRQSEWVASGTKTITFKVYPHGWSALDNTVLFLEAWYLDSASGVSRTKAVTGSTTFSNDSWQDLSVTVTPAQDGIVYFNLVLAKYEASAYVLIDPVWSVS